MSPIDPKEPDGLKAADPIAQSRYGEVLPGLELVSEGDIDLDDLPSQFDAMPAAQPPTAPSRRSPPLTPVGAIPSDPVAQSRFGDSLPGLELVSEGEINLDNLPSQFGEMPAVKPAASPTLKLDTPKAARAKSSDTEAQSLFGESLPGVDLASDGDVNLGELPSHFGLVPLAKLPEPPSGQSLTSWTEVIRRQRAAQVTAQTADAVKVDAASDKDLLTKLVEAEARSQAAADGQGAKEPDTDEYPEASLPVFTQPRSESEIDLGPFSPGEVGGESDIKFDIMYPPSDAGGAMPLPSGGLPPLSGVDFRKHMPPKSGSGLLDEESIPFAVAVATDPSESDLDLGGDIVAVPGEPGRSSILDVLLREPDAAAAAEQASDLLDFGALQPIRSGKPTMPTTGAGPARPQHVSTQPGIDLAGGDVPPESAIMNLAGPASGYGSDDAIDLYAEGGAIPSLSDSGTLEISEQVRAESQRRTDAQESSSIDLNSRPGSSGTEFELNVSSPAARGSESDIDLSLPAVADVGSSSLVQPPGGLAANRKALSAEFESRRRKGDEPPRDRPRDIVPLREEYGGGRRGRGYLIRGGVLGLLLGAGSVLAAYFGGALPNRGDKVVAGSPDNSAELAKLRDEATEARKQAENAKQRANVAVAQREANDTKIGELAAAATKAQNDLTAARKLAEDAKTAEDTAKKNLVESEKTVAAAKTELADFAKTATTAKKELADATKALDDARKETTDVKKAAEDKLAIARAAAEAKDKEAALKLAEAAKKETDLTKLVDSAKKSAEAAAAARDASDATVKAIGDRLAKAKFVGDQADTAALVKGLDAAIKAATTDSTAGLREDLVKARDAEAKLKAELSAAQVKEVESAKTAATMKAEAQKLQQDLKVVETKAAQDLKVVELKAAQDLKTATTKAETDTVKLKGDNEKLSKDAAEASEKAAAAEKIAAQEKAQADRLGTELSKLRTDNERLARELEAVRQVAEFLKTSSGAAIGPLVRPEPSKLAERFFNEGLREYYGGRYSAAESDFRKSLQLNPDDARVHYFLGLALWMAKDAKGAEVEFEKGRDLEMAGRPGSRAISNLLEKVQGPARQVVNAYRP